MKMKTVVIFVCMLLIITALSATGATNFHNSVYIRENNDLDPFQSIPTKSPGVITIKIDAQITGVQDTNNLLEGKIKVNDSITGKYTYDSGTPDSNSDPHVGVYKYNSSTYGIKLEAGGFVFETNSSDVDFGISIADNFSYYYNWDLFTLESNNNSELSNGLLVIYIGWGLIDTTGNALSSDALPTTAPVLSDWEENILIIMGSSSSYPYDSYFIMANVTKVTKSRSKARDVHFSTQPILIWLFERFPNLVPILKQLLEFL
jgi:hypothetical protein